MMWQVSNLRLDKLSKDTFSKRCKENNIAQANVIRAFIMIFNRLGEDDLKLFSKAIRAKKEEPKKCDSILDRLLDELREEEED